MNTALFTASTAATALNLSGDKRQVTVTNLGAGSVYLGSSSVSSTSGFELPSGDTVETHVPASDVLYAVTSTGVSPSVTSLAVTARVLGSLSLSDTATGGLALSDAA